MAQSTDQTLSLGFAAGNYAAAYETSDFNQAIASLSPNRSLTYVQAFTVSTRKPIWRLSTLRRASVAWHSDTWTQSQSRITTIIILGRLHGKPLSTIPFLCLVRSNLRQKWDVIYTTYGAWDGTPFFRNQKEAAELARFMNAEVIYSDRELSNE